MAPKHVKPYLQGQKDDANDAAAICEAVSRPRMRFVTVKSVAQQVSNLRRALVELLEDAQNGLTADCWELLSGLREDLA